MGLQQFLNGVSEKQILALVDRYDRNGDGNISYEEFLQMIRNHKAPVVKPLGSTRKVASNIVDQDDNLSDDRGDWSDLVEANLHNNGNNSDDSQHSEDDGFNPIPAPAPANLKKKPVIKKRPDQRDDDETRSEASSNLDVSNPRELESRLRVFIQNLKTFLVKKAMEASKNRSTGFFHFSSCSFHPMFSIQSACSIHSGAQDNFRQLSLTTAQQHEDVAQGVLSKLFAPYSAAGGGKIGAKVDPDSTDSCVEFNNFAR